MLRLGNTRLRVNHRGAAKLLWTNTNKLNTTIQFASLTQFCVRSGHRYAGITSRPGPSGTQNALDRTTIFLKNRPRGNPGTFRTRTKRRVAILTSCSQSTRRCHIGGARRDRTADLLRAKQALSQLSYGPVIWWVWEDLNFRPHPYQGCALTN